MEAKQWTLYFAMASIHKLSLNSKRARQSSLMNFIMLLTKQHILVQHTEVLETLALMQARYFFCLCRKSIWLHFVLRWSQSSFRDIHDFQVPWVVGLQQVFILYSLRIFRLALLMQILSARIAHPKLAARTTVCFRQAHSLPTPNLCSLRWRAYKR